MKSRWSKLLWATLVAIGLIAVGSPAFAQETGILAGKVVAEVDGAELPGATVTIEGTDINGVTDRSGNYRLVGVPAGDQTVMVVLAGFGEMSQTVTVQAGQVTDLHLSLPLTFAGTVEVFGLEYGYRKSVAEQKESDTIVTIVSEETLDYLPDHNMGETLGRLPGITFKKDRGEVEQIYIRGADARLNAVTVNGDHLTSPESTVTDAFERGNRAVSLNNLPASLIGGVEVWKAVPASRDADSVGGLVNIMTKSASGLSGQVLDVTLQGGQYELSEKGLFTAEANYGTRLNQSGTWGLMATASWEEHNRGDEGIQAEWATIDEVLDLETDDDVPLGFEGYVQETFTTIWRDIKRTRQGATLTLDHQPSANSLFKLGGFWAEFDDEEQRRRVDNRAGASADYTTETVFNDDLVAVSGSTDGGRARRRIRLSETNAETLNFFLDGSHLFGAGSFEFNWRASTLTSDRLLERTYTRWEARAGDIGLQGDGVADWTLANGDTDTPTWGVPAWSNDPDILQVGRRGDYNQLSGDYSEDSIDAVRLDFKKALGSGGNFDLEFGYKGRWRDRFVDYTQVVWAGVRNNPTFMSETLDTNTYTPVHPYGYDNGMFGDQLVMDQIFIDHPDRFVYSDDFFDESYSVEETINAGFLMGTWRTGRLTANAGVRYEDVETSVVAVDGEATNDYGDFFPSVILRYQASDKIILRAAWTNAIGRPDFYKIRPRYSTDFTYEINDDTGLYEGELYMDGGNPALLPFYSDNYDLTFEYYMGSGGVLSAAVFYKDITAFEYTEEFKETNVNISDLPDYLQGAAQAAVDDARQNDPNIPQDFDTLTRFNYARPINGDKSTVLGVELNWQQRFVGLPAPFDKFGIFANFTFTDATADLATDISRDYLTGQSRDAANLQLFWEDRYISARVAYNRNGVIYESVGLSLDDDGEVVDIPADDQYRDVEESLVFAFQWYVSPKFTLLFDVKNLLNQDTVRRALGSDGTPQRFVELENDGRAFVFGVRYRL